MASGPPIIRARVAARDRASEPRVPFRSGVRFRRQRDSQLIAGLTGHRSYLSGAAAAWMRLRTRPVFRGFGGHLGQLSCSLEVGL